MITLYHGTTLESFNGITESGAINGRVYASPNIQTAIDYASAHSDNIVIIELCFDKSELEYDSEFINGDTSDWVQESLDAGSVYIDRDVLVSEFVSSSIMEC